jgi:superfamily II DNA or RNA helicase
MNNPSLEYSTLLRQNWSDEPIMSILRDYQVKAVLDIENSFLSGKTSPLAQAPTGAGKSIIILAVSIRRILAGDRVGLICHKEELLKQWLNHFERWLPGFPRGVLGDKTRYGALRDTSAQLQIMTVKTLHRATDKPDLDLLVFDECHHLPASEWAGVLHEYRKRNIKYILGATATPLRLDGKGLDLVDLRINKKRHVIKAFDALIPGPQSADLIDSGHLVPIELHAGSSMANTDNAKMQCGDFKPSELAEIVDTDVPVSVVYDNWFEIAGPDVMTIAYPVSVEYSKKLEVEFNSRISGIARHIDANTPAGERDQAFKDFNNGKIKVLLQHSIVIEGVDIPDVRCVLNIRPTASIAVWLQILGRGLRPAPGKDKMILIDFTDNHIRLPMPGDRIEWSLYGAKVANFFDCPKCKKERRFFHVRDFEAEFYREKFWECAKCATEISFKTDREDKIKESEEKKKSKPKLSKKTLKRRDFDFKKEPDFYNFYDRCLEPEDLDREMQEYIFCLHQHRKFLGGQPFSAMYKLIPNFYREDLEPSDNILYLVAQAFIKKNEMHEKDELDLPDLSDPKVRGLINKTRWVWGQKLKELY